MGWYANGLASRRSPAPTDPPGPDSERHAVVRFDGYALDFVPHLLTGEATSVGFAVRNRTREIPVPEQPPCPTTVELEVFPEVAPPVRDRGLPAATGTFERRACASLSALAQGPRCLTTPSPSGCSGVRATAFREATAAGQSAFRYRRDLDALAFAGSGHAECTHRDGGEHRFSVRTCHFTPPYSHKRGCSRDHVAVSCRTEAYTWTHGPLAGASVQHRERVVPDSFRAHLMADGNARSVLHIALRTRTARDARPVGVSVQVAGKGERTEAATLFLGAGQHRATVPVSLEPERRGTVRVAVQVLDADGTPLYAASLGLARAGLGEAPPVIRYQDTVLGATHTHASGSNRPLQGTCLHASVGPGHAIDLAPPVVCGENGTPCREASYRVLLRDGDAAGHPPEGRLRCTYRCSCVAACLELGHLQNGTYFWLHGVRVSTTVLGRAADRGPACGPPEAVVRSYARGTRFAFGGRGEQASPEEGLPPRSGETDVPLTLAIVALLVSLAGAAIVVALRCRMGERRRARRGPARSKKDKRAI